MLGNSAGSVPAAMAGISRPDLLSALILEIPLSDLVRHAKWSEGWATEFGDPDDPEELSALLEISPYEALQTPKSLPPTLILAGENDRTAPPLHAYKLTAAMQNAQLGNDEILLLRIPGAGHQIGADSEQRRESQALELAFLAKSLEMEFDGR